MKKRLDFLMRGITRAMKNMFEDLKARVEMNEREVPTSCNPDLNLETLTEK